jgi:mRNA-degrading endonuclease RelE of RelBE toxin-antitoxin system
MNISVKVTKGFKRQVKPLIKKYISLKTELRDLHLSLMENPEQGTLITTDVYKIRMGVKSKGRGKSGGLRVITFVETLIIAKIEQIDEANTTEKIVNLIAIYDKTDTANIAQQDIEILLSAIDFDED